MNQCYPVAHSSHLLGYDSCDDHVPVPPDRRVDVLRVDDVLLLVESDADATFTALFVVLIRNAWGNETRVSN